MYATEAAKLGLGGLVLFFILFILNFF
jgi:hypothetical protein